MKMNKRLLVTSGMMLSAVAIALSTNTYAWFTMSNENTLSEFEIQARAASGGLEISLNGSDFSDSSVNMASPNLKALDVTSPDGIQMFKATVVSESTGLPTTFAYATTNTDFYEFDLYFRTVNSGYVCVDGSSCTIKPSAATLDGTDADNKSNSGDFSRDYIAGAARFSFQVTGYQNDASATWLSASNGSVYGAPYIVTPNNTYSGTKTVDNIYLSQDEVTRVWTVGEQANHDNIYKPSDDPKFAKDATISSTEYAALSEQQKKLVKYENSVYTAIQDIYGIPTGLSSLSSDKLTAQGWPTTSAYALAHIGGASAATNPTTSAITGAFTSGQNQITKVTCRVWLEGQDNEAKTALAQGKFKINLKFKFIPGTIEATTKLAAPTLVKSGTSLTWSQVVGAVGYEVYTRSGAGTTADPYVYAIVGSRTTSLYMKGLTTGTTYYVKAINADSAKPELDSDYSDAVTL